MISKKLEALLASLNVPARNRFRKFLASPYFNEQQELSALLEVLLEPIPATDKAQVWQKIFGDKPYQDGQMRRLISALITQLLDFLAIEQCRRKSVRARAELLDTLHHPRFALHFASIMRQIQTEQEKSVQQDADFHFHQYLIERQWYRQMELSERSPDMMTKLNDAGFHLDCFFLSQKLQFYCDFLGYKDFLSIDTKYDTLSFATIENNCTPRHLAVPAIRIYYLIAQMLMHPAQETFYYDAKYAINEYAACFKKAEAKSFYIHLINYCIHKKINIGETRFFQELFSVYQALLDKGILLDDEGVLEPQHYKLIVSVGLQIQAFEWVEQFIQTHTRALPPDAQDNALTYNLAKVYFQQGYYTKVITLLQEVEYESLDYALGAKLMLLKTYYELNEFLALDSMIDSFRIYLMRNKLISKEVRRQYLNVLRFVRKLSTIILGNREAIIQIRRDIDACKMLADKNWILSKLQELEEANV